ncbi:MAG: hypothetical protein IH845_04660, partial [Nanoarchaeota archaeon]|nr:hypothetical protein [Nanoarchaeota archaeon]
MSFVEILALVYLLLFSIYHLFTGIVSVFFSEFALKFYKKIYGLEHLAILILKTTKPSKKVFEKDVVYLINGFQILIVILGFLLI